MYNSDSSTLLFTILHDSLAFTMPRKQVYGRSTRSNAFGAPASVFWDRDKTDGPLHEINTDNGRQPASPRCALEHLSLNASLARSRQNRARRSRCSAEFHATPDTHLLEENLDPADIVLPSIEKLSIRDISVLEPPHLPRPVPLANDEVLPKSQPIPEKPKRRGRTASDKRAEQQSYVAPLLSLCFNQDEQSEILDFSEWSDEIQEHFDVAKIAEASFSEVYRMRFKSVELCLPLPSAEESVLKLIPLKPPPRTVSAAKRVTKVQKAREDMMSAVDSVVSEVRLLQRMTDIPGFVNFRDVHILKGRPSKLFIQAWKEHNNGLADSQKSFFPDPSKKASYSDDQLWAVIEMQDAGTDLEKVKLPTIFHVWDIFWHVVIAVAQAETECRFEHRDLHLGNVCVRRSGEENDRDENEITVSDKKIGYTGLEGTIIDYTYSRADMRPYAIGDDEELHHMEVAYQDLQKDEELFLGDARSEYQYEMYRYMHSAFFRSDPAVPYRHTHTAPHRKNWRDFQPLTNLVWLHFLLHTFLAQLEVWPSKNMDGTLELLQSGCSRKRAERRAKRLEKILRVLRDTLRIESMGPMAETGLASAGDLVWLALQEKWLDEDDLLGSK